ncbi:uncharacterized protein LOC143793247 [Ranitomeya variabilis]|uniref:uncharacterized protein LOC143793247 n=1 Tax=Ranitomeya variabilis TaxID=490064 RepID=UPI0040561A4B
MSKMHPSFLHINLKEISTSGKTAKTRGYYARGEFLSIEEIYKCLSIYKNLKHAGKIMKDNIESVINDDFLHVPLEFPVLALQHVTSQDLAKKILESKSFKGRIHERSEFNHLSFWSADISTDDIEKGHLQMYETMRMKVKAEELDTFHVEMMREQFANSPAFNKSASSYGNFNFSLPLSLLLCRYKTQHCKGKEPQLRILGTDIYKQEIAHYIIVHNPDNKDFEDLRMVATMPTTSQNPKIVTWMDETLHWRPQSTSSSLHLSISDNSCQSRMYSPRKQRMPHRKMRPREPSCVWNHLVFAFHLPNDAKLQFPIRYLLRNLTPCHALQPFIKLDPILKIQAQEIIWRFKKDFLESSQDSRKPPPPPHSAKLKKDSSETKQQQEASGPGM